MVGNRFTNLPNS